MLMLETSIKAEFAQQITQDTKLLTSEGFGNSNTSCRYASQRASIDERRSSQF